MTSLICPHCDAINLVDLPPVIVTEADGDHTCLDCGHHWRPRPSLAYLATEKLLTLLGKKDTTP